MCEETMKKVVILSVLFLFIALTGSAWAGSTGEQKGLEKQAFFMKSGQDLVDLCSVAEDHPLYDKATAFCYGYMTGAMNFYGAIAQSPKMPKVICSAEEIPRSQMVAVFLDWAKTNKKHLSEAPIDALVRSAVAKWPCEKK